MFQWLRKPGPEVSFRPPVLVKASARKYDPLVAGKAWVRISFRQATPDEALYSKAIVLVMWIARGHLFLRYGYPCWGQPELIHPFRDQDSQWAPFPCHART
jgi:hypothetical protein